MIFSPLQKVYWRRLGELPLVSYLQLLLCSFFYHEDGLSLTLGNVVGMVVGMVFAGMVKQTKLTGFFPVLFLPH